MRTIQPQSACKILLSLAFCAATSACGDDSDPDGVALGTGGTSSGSGGTSATGGTSSGTGGTSSGTGGTSSGTGGTSSGTGGTAGTTTVELITDIDFNNHANNTMYDKDLVDGDFRNYLTSTGPGNWGGGISTNEDGKDREIMIVDDPAGTNGGVLRSTYFAGSSGSRFAAHDHFSRTHYNLMPVGGDSAAVDYPKSAYAESSADPGRPPGEPGESAETRENDPTQRRYDELYASVDMMFSPGFVPIPYHKLWGLNSGSPEQSSHGTTPCYNTEGYYGLLAWLLVTGREWDRNGTSGSDGSMAMYEYSAEKIFVTRWLNRNDFTVTDRSDMEADDFYIPPRGEWFTVEIHVKLNTADDDYRTVVDTSPQSCGPGGHKIDIPGGYRADHPTAGDLEDGIVEIWVTDPRSFADGGTDGTPKKMYESVLRQRWWNYLKYTHFFMQDWSNNNDGVAEFYPDQDQYTYFDNIKVSESRIHP